MKKGYNTKFELGNKLKLLPSRKSFVLQSKLFIYVNLITFILNISSFYDEKKKILVTSFQLQLYSQAPPSA